MPYSPKSVFAPVPRTERGMPLVLHGDPKGKNILYAIGNSIIIRDIEDPGISDVYTQHSVATSVACYAPSGFYIASGDSSGKIRIWDTTQKEHILKYEYQPLSGKIKDIAWSPDSKRIAVCGEGREKFGHVFLWDSGSSVGEIMGHSKFINSIDYRPVRPFRVVTAGEDTKIGWFEGPPFRYKNAFKEHTRFVNAIRFSADGALFCSGGADGKAVVFDGSTGEKKCSLGGDKAHDGGIYALSWGPDSSQVLTASGDKTCKLWDVSTCQMVSEFKMGSTVEDQQVSCLWQGSHLLSVSLSGFINYLDVDNPKTPLRVIKGQNKNLTSLASVSGSVYAGSMDGRISCWEMESGQVDLVSGQSHSNLVCSLHATPEKLFSLGLDKSMKTSMLADKEFRGEGVALPGLDPTGMAVTADEDVVIATLTEVVLVRDGKRVDSVSVNYQPQGAAAHPSLPEAAVCGKDNSVHVYTISGDTLKEKTTFQAGKEAVSLAYSHNGSFLAVASGRHVLVFNTTSYEQIGDLQSHNAKVLAVDWSPNSAHIVSCSIDTHVVVWDVERRECLQSFTAHPLSVVTGVAWVSDTVLASCGHDCCIRTWEQTA